MAPAAILRVARWAVARSRTQREADERARRKLHQICGAFQSLSARAALRKWLERLPGQASDISILRMLFAEMLQLHLSTRERFDSLERFYQVIFYACGTPRSIIDLGCGLNPFTLPWMPEPIFRSVHYLGSDIDGELLEVVAAAGVRLGCSWQVRCTDLLEAGDGGECFDLAFLFKLLPTLEQEDLDAPAEILRRLPARRAVVSFPVRSLCGRSCGMRENYAEKMQQWSRQAGGECRRLAFEQELLFLFEKG